MRPRQINRGFAAIGLHRPKDKANVGGAIRAAMCYDAVSIAISGDRIDASWIKTPSNTVAGQRHIPVLRGDLRGLIPYGAVPVAVDLVDDAEPLPTFLHPESAFYVFGPEDGTLGSAVLDWCPRRVMVPTRYCMNLAATVNVILYDRLAKRSARQALLASGTEAQRAETVQLGSVHDGPAPKADAQPLPPELKRTGSGSWQ
jgi:tRNA(Leu) C34 or U34 (ribose-2'-O)-methylase TrmL